MNTFRLLRENLTLTVLAVLVCGLLGFLTSLPIGMLSHREAMIFQYTSSPSGFRQIETSKLEALNRMQTSAVLTGVAIGLLAAQSVFLVFHLRPKHENDKAA